MTFSRRARLGLIAGAATLGNVVTPSLGGAQMVRIVDIIPNSRSVESGQDSEPNVAINPANTRQVAISAFTPDPGGSANAPIFVSTNGGSTWALNAIVPGGNTFNGTSDITLRFGGASGVLYAGVLRGDNLNFNILRTSDFTSATPMTILVNRAADDQPYVQAMSVLSGAVTVDRVYIGNNNVGLDNTTGRSSSVDLSQDAATAAAPAGFTTQAIESRAAAILPDSYGSQDAPSIRTAVHASGVVYAAYIAWRTFGTGTVQVNTSDIVVARDDNFGTGTTPFGALTDPVDHVAGVRVATGVSIPSLGTRLGAQRIGSSLSIAVDPNNSQHVYLAWADGATSAAYTIHIRVSQDGGQSWSSDIRSIVPGTNPAIAVANDGTVGFLYQKWLAASGGAPNMWETHLELTGDDFSGVRDFVLHRAPDNVGVFAGAGPLGDYDHLMTVGRVFVGVFSGNNLPDTSNFPSGVTYRREVDWAKKKLYSDATHTTETAPSIDPYYFTVNTFPNICDRLGAACHALTFDPWWWLKCPACIGTIFVKPGDDYRTATVVDEAGRLVGPLVRLAHPVMIDGVAYSYKVDFRLQKGHSYLLTAQRRAGSPQSRPFDPVYVVRVAKATVGK
jgi:hypothetical protein